MAKKPSKQKVPSHSAETAKLLQVEVAFWRDGGSPVRIRDSAGKELNHKEAVEILSKATGYTSAAIGERLGASKRTVQGWKIGKPISPVNGLRLKEWLDQDAMTKLLVEATRNSSVQSGSRSTPERSESGKSPNNKKR